MTSRERMIKTLKHEQIDRFPRDLWTLPGIAMFRKQELEDVLAKYPGDIGRPDFRYGHGNRCRGDVYTVGEYTDAWGCVWRVGEPGVVGEVKEYILSDWSALDRYSPPWEILKEADLSQVNSSCANSSLFILADTEVRPFERMQFLRGTENLFMDLAYGEKEIYQLRDMLHEFHCAEMEMWASTDIDGVRFMDDWGTQKTLLISPSLWRSFFKPLYRDYCEILHSKGKFAFFHSDGNIELIYPDLIEIGIDAVNSQLFCMNIEALGNLYSGKIVFWGEIDRQNILPFGSVQDVKNAVQRVSGALIKEKRTGVIAQCEWGNKDPKVNIEAVFEEWNRI